MRLNPILLTLSAFVSAAALSILMALFVGNALESRSERHVKRALVAEGLDWTAVSADGLIVTLTGTAPTEAMRFRAATVAGRIAGSGRVIDEMDVTPARALTAPRFSLELLRNDDGVSMIGLVPTAWDTASLTETAQTAAQAGSLANMLETADFAIPEGWVPAVDFGLAALRLLPRSKISVAADGVQVTAIADSPAQKRRFEEDLGRALPQGVPVDIRISAPRPVIAPFTLRFVIDDQGARFDACAADSDRALGRILTAARNAGVPGTPACTQGLGAPSPRWAEAAEAVIAAMAELGAGSVTISDVDVTLIAAPTVTQSDFDLVVGELTARLPDVFSLKATLVPRPEAEGTQGPAQFTATLSPEGTVQLRGRLPDERMRDAAQAFARARFGAGDVYVAARLDEGLPPGWSVRVLAAWWWNPAAWWCAASPATPRPRPPSRGCCPTGWARGRNFRSRCATMNGSTRPAACPTPRNAWPWRRRFWNGARSPLPPAPWTSKATPSRWSTNWPARWPIVAGSRWKSAGTPIRKAGPS